MTTDYAIQADPDLVISAQNGDTRAFDELVRRYRDKVYRLSYKILRNEDDAAEALQDAFLSAYRGLKNFKAESTFSTWLYRITTNASLMKYRKRRDNLVSLEQSQSQNEDAETLQALAQPQRQQATGGSGDQRGQGQPKDRHRRALSRDRLRPRCHQRRRGRPVRLRYSAIATPEPPISLGRSCSFGRPSCRRRRVSW